MKTRTLLGLALFIITTVLLSGCGKTDANLQSENAGLKARVQQLEQQLQASRNQAAAPPTSASNQDLQGQLAEAQKKADAANDQLKSLHSQVDSLKQKVDDLTRQLTDAQQATETAEKALRLYKDKTSSALRQFQALRRTLNRQTPDFDVFHRNYLATRTAVNDSVAILPDSGIRRQMISVLAQLTHLDSAWETATRQMQTRTANAKAQYDKFIDFGGLGPNRYVIEMGKEKILAPAEKANAATASDLKQQMASSEQDLDHGIHNLESLING